MVTIRVLLFAGILGASHSLFAAEDANPFAKWDRLKKETSAIESTDSTKSAARPALNKDARPSSGTSLEYFSPKGAEPGVEGESAKPPATPKAPAEVKHERLTPTTTAKATPAKPAAPAARSAQSASEMAWPAPGNTSGSKQAASTPASDAEHVANAAFVEVPQQKKIQQISGAKTASATSNQSNPFAEFLMEKEAVTGTSSPFDVAAEAPVFDDFSESGKATLPPQPAKPEPVAVQGPQTPAVTLQWVHHSDFNIGQECRCELVLENTGRATVRNVVAEAVLPVGLEVISSKPVPVTAGGSATWTFGELAPGEKRQVELVVIPRQQGNLQMDAFVRMTGASSSSFAVKEPKLAIRIDGPLAVEVGQQVNYTVQVTNPGTGAARNVVIQTAVPEGLEHRSGSLLTIEIGTLNPGESRQARLSLTGVKGGEYTLAARALGEGGLTQQIQETVSIAEPRLNIGIRGPSSRMTGQTCDFELVVANEGKVQSNNVRAKYKVPEGFEFVAADRGGKLNTNDGTIDWFVGTLDPNQISHFKITLRPMVAGESVHQVGIISEHGRMTMAEHRTEVLGNANLDLKIAASNRQVRPGEETVFELHIANTGASSAANVGVSCELPSGLELLEVSGPSEYIADSGVMVFRAMPELAPGKSALFAIRTRCIRPGSHRMRARVASDSIRDPLIGEETATGVNE